MSGMPTEAAPGISDELFHSLWNTRCELRYHAWVQVRYQRRRERFFDLLDKATKAITLVLGGALFGPALAWLPWAATGITALALLALIFGYGDRKHLHARLATQAAHMVAAIERVPTGTITPDIVADWSAQYARFCADAPPPLKTLTLLCEREQSIADGRSEHVKQPKRWRGLLAQLKS